jgi:hypothetical protein
MAGHAPRGWPCWAWVAVQDKHPRPLERLTDLADYCLRSRCVSPLLSVSTRSTVPFAFCTTL